MIVPVAWLQRVPTYKDQIDALGPEMVHSFMLPSPYTSRDSLEDAASCAAMLGIPCDTVSISGAMEAFGSALRPIFAGRQADITEETLLDARSHNFLTALFRAAGKEGLPRM